MMKILSIFGARPQFVKAAMVSAAIRRHNHRVSSRLRILHRLVHTGQHYEYTMSGVFFDQLPLPKPDYYLGVGSDTHGAQTAAILERTEPVLVKERPDVTLVYGDTNSTLAGVLAAAKMRIPVAHVEAGLRSFNRRMPEEVNRVASDHLSDVLLCPTRTGVDNLRQEGIRKNVFLTGDVMLDAVMKFRGMAARRSNVLGDLGLRAKDYLLVTVHRAENTDYPERLETIFDTLVRSKRPVVFPMHPRVRDRLARSAEYRSLRLALRHAPNVRVIDPLPYLDMLSVEENARVVLTDSGGVQKEAFFLGVPCLTLREETEWVETLRGGWNRVIGTAPQTILPLVESLWSHNGAFTRGRPAVQSFGQGDAAMRVVQSLLRYAKSTRAD